MTPPSLLSSVFQRFFAATARPAGILAMAAALLVPLDSARAALIGNSFTGAGIYSIDTATGAATLLSSTTSVSLAGIAFQPGTGDLFGLTSLSGSPANSLVRINPLTGAVTTVGATGLSSIVEGDLAFNPINGLLYGMEDTSGGVRSFFQINPTTGAATVLGTFSNTIDYSAIAFDSAGTLFALNTLTSGTGNAVLSTLNPTNGAILTSVTTNVDLGALAGMAFDPFSGTGYIVDGGTGGTNSLYTLNIPTGTLTAVGSLGVANGLAGLSFTPPAAATSVPDTGSTFALLAAALLGITALHRRTARA